MAWTVSVQLRDTINRSGVVTATWNAGEADEFSYYERAKQATFNTADFTANAEAARTKHEAKVALEAGFASTIATALNQ